MNKQFKKGVLDLVLLHLIHESPATAYELLKKLETTLGVTQNTIYPLLRRLENDGFLTHERSASQVGAPKKLFKLTANGLEHYRNLYNDWMAFNTKIEAILGGQRHE